MQLHKGCYLRNKNHPQQPLLRGRVEILSQLNNALAYFGYYFLRSLFENLQSKKIKWLGPYGTPVIYNFDRPLKRIHGVTLGTSFYCSPGLNFHLVAHANSLIIQRKFTNK